VIWRIRHRDGWTGKAEIMNEEDTGNSSHACSFRVSWFITQDATDITGRDVEDPHVTSWTDLTFLERIA
jgi:hypothetical protein